MNIPSPLTILIGALGGEGGGVLADWLTRAAEINGYPVQRTSIPGVAQRTGATTYYLEIVPATREQIGTEDLILALAPVPGQVDLMVASELLEAGRAAQAGLLSAERTTLIASTHRVFTVAEKSAMGDGRYSEERLTGTLERFTKRAILFDMEATARASGAVISAVMLGAIAGSGLLPIPRASFEEAIRRLGKGGEASLAGFAAGFDAVDQRQTTMSNSAPQVQVHESVGARFPKEVGDLVDHGYRRLLDYQDRRYAELYLDRVAQIYAAEKSALPTSDHKVTEAVARFLALWMSYEDVIRVADLKSRTKRLQRIRADVGAKPDEPVRVIEFMKPGIEEWCAILPRPIADRLRRWASRRGRHLNIELHVRTTSVHGFVLLRLLAGLRWWRPRTSRYAEEQALMERWLEEIVRAVANDPALALEVALCGRLIKGYGSTQARGKSSFCGILDALSHPLAGSATSRASVIRSAREAALADPEGKALEQSLGAHGVPYSRPGTKPVPVIWRRSARGAAQR